MYLQVLAIQANTVMYHSNICATFFSFSLFVGYFTAMFFLFVLVLLLMRYLFSCSILDFFFYRQRLRLWACLLVCDVVRSKRKFFWRNRKPSLLGMAQAILGNRIAQHIYHLSVSLTPFSAAGNNLIWHALNAGNVKLFICVGYWRGKDRCVY